MSLSLRYRPVDRLCVIYIHCADPQLHFTRLMVHYYFGLWDTSDAVNLGRIHHGERRLAQSKEGKVPWVGTLKADWRV